MMTKGKSSSSNTATSLIFAMTLLRITVNLADTILDICKTEGISLVELMDSIRDKCVGAKKLLTIEEKKRYLLHLIRTMSADGRFPSLELHIIEIIAKKLEVNPMLLLSFVLDEICERHISKDEVLVIVDNFVRHYITIGL